LDIDESQKEQPPLRYEYHSFRNQNDVLNYNLWGIPFLFLMRASAPFS